MKIDTKLILQLAVFAIIDVVIPIPLMAGLLIYVVITRPSWFLEIVNDLYKPTAEN